MTEQNWLYVVAQIEVPVVFATGREGGHVGESQGGQISVPVAAKLIRNG